MTILIVDDHPLVRCGVKNVLEVETQVEQIIEVGNIKEAVETLQKTAIDIVLVDINLGKENGFELVEAAKEEYLMTKFVMLTSSSSMKDFNRAKELGVAGYILKDEFIEDIVYAIRTIQRGKKFFSDRFLDEIMASNKQNEGLDKLTQREKEVVEAIQEGKNNQQISKILCITEGTVKKHISNILGKLQLNNRVELMIYQGQKKEV